MIPCQNCGKDFIPDKPTQQYCKVSCRVRAFQKRKATHEDLCPTCGGKTEKVDAECSLCRLFIKQPDDLSIRYIKLTKGYFAVVSALDYERVMRYRWQVLIAYRKDGMILNVYAQRSFRVKNKRHGQTLHRFIMNIDDRKINVDHEDHDGLNCRRSNLRVATGTQNNGNRRKLILNTASRFKGVWKGKAKWRAVLALEKKMVYLGAHFIEEDAARAYDRAAIEYFGEFACINFPEEHLEFPYSHA